MERQNDLSGVLKKASKLILKAQSLKPTSVRAGFKSQKPNSWAASELIFVICCLYIGFFIYHIINNQLPVETVHAPSLHKNKEKQQTLESQYIIFYQFPKITHSQFQKI